MGEADAGSHRGQPRKLTRQFLKEISNIRSSSKVAFRFGVSVLLSDASTIKQPCCTMYDLAQFLAGQPSKEGWRLNFVTCV